MDNHLPPGDAAVADVHDAGHGEHRFLLQRAGAGAFRVLGASDLLAGVLWLRGGALSCVGMVAGAPRDFRAETLALADRAVGAGDHDFPGSDESRRTAWVYLFPILRLNKNITGGNRENGGCGIKPFSNPRQGTVVFKTGSPARQPLRSLRSLL